MIEAKESDYLISRGTHRAHTPHCKAHTFKTPVVGHAMSWAWTSLSLKTNNPPYMQHHCLHQLKVSKCLGPTMGHMPTQPFTAQHARICTYI